MSREGAQDKDDWRMRINYEMAVKRCVCVGGVCPTIIDVICPFYFVIYYTYVTKRLCIVMSFCHH